MYAEDMTIFEQMFCVSLLTFVIVGAMLLGMAMKEHELKEEQRKRDAENAAHRAATEGATRGRLDTWA